MIEKFTLIRTLRGCIETLKELEKYCTHNGCDNCPFTTCSIVDGYLQCPNQELALEEDIEVLSELLNDLEKLEAFT